jgi:splicing factor 3B subunit 2
MADHSLLPGAFIFFNRTPTGVETPDVIDLRKTQRKEPEKPLYHVLEEKEERIQPGTLLGASHT